MAQDLSSQQRQLAAEEATWAARSGDKDGFREVVDKVTGDKPVSDKADFMTDVRITDAQAPRV